NGMHFHPHRDCQVSPPIRDAPQDKHTDAPSLADHFIDDWRLVSDRPTGRWAINHHKTRRRNASCNALLFGQDLVESDPAGFRATAGITHTQFFQTLLNRAVLAVSSVQS